MPRRIAADVLERIELDAAYSHIALNNALQDSTLDERDRGLVTELVYGTLTWQRTLDAILGGFVRGEFQKLEVPVQINLRMALYQLEFLDRIPPHAVVDEAVGMVKADCGRGASGLVNGVLRTILRSEEPLVAYTEQERVDKPDRYLGKRYSLPNWLARRLIAMHGLEHAEALAEAFSKRPRLYLRTMDLRTPRKLARGIEAVPNVPGALAADGFTDAVREDLNKYRVVVQDLGSQLIGWFADAQPGDTVLDACAGLGGKTLHLAQITATQTAPVTAVDPNASKTHMLRTAIRNTGLPATVHTSTLQEFATSSAAAAAGYDRVLVDAPCTGLGVIRRHPEMRWRRTEADVAPLVALQVELLDCAANLVVPGGVLVYSVCTFTDEEGPAQVEAFLMRHPDFERAPAPASEVGIDWSTYTNEAGELRLNPLDHDCDAFFAARLRRKDA